MIGQMRHRVTIQQPSDASDSHGGYTRTWTTLATVNACIEPKSAKERFFAAKVEHNVTHVITIWHRTDITTDMRVSFGSRVFQIHGIITPMERTQFIKLMCEEGVGS